MSRFDAGLSKHEHCGLIDRFDANSFLTTYERVVTDIEHLETRAKDTFKRTAKELVEHLWINDRVTEYGMEWVLGRFADLVERANFCDKGLNLRWNVLMDTRKSISLTKI